MSIMEPDRWLGVELRHLAALQAVAQEGSFGRAAQRLGYTQSAISPQIAALERVVGERLIERPGGPRPVSLTEAGKLLLGHADAIVARMQAAHADLAALFEGAAGAVAARMKPAKADLAAFSEGAAGTLRVGTYQSVSAKILPAVVSRFKDA